MRQVDQQELTFAATREVLRKPGGTAQQIGGGASYKTETFIGYFRARNRDLVTDVHLQQYLARPRCVAASCALHAGSLTQSAATWYVRDELQEILDLRLDRTRFWSFPERCVELVTHVARLFYLSGHDAAKPLFDRALVRSLSEAYKSDRGLLEPTIWRVRVARFETGSASLLHDAGPVHRENREFDDYLQYWTMANSKTLDGLLRSRHFCAGIHALTLRAKQGTTPMPVLSALDEAFSGKLHPLFRRLRHRLYTRLAEDADLGLLKLPRGLRAEFPDIYEAERSSTGTEPA